MQQGYTYYPAPTAVHAPFQTPFAGFPGELPTQGGNPVYGTLAAPQGFPHLSPGHPQFPSGYYQPTQQQFAAPAPARAPRNYGYSEAPPASEEQAWDELDDEEQAAAEELGYTRHSWNHNAVMPWDRLTWAELTPLVRERLETLGWTAPAWDYHEVELAQHAQMQAAARQPAVEHTRVYIEKMAPRVPGGRPLAQQPQMESNVTLGPTGHLAPVLGCSKQWYNTRIYLPEEPRMKGYAPQYKDRFVQTAEGLWIDTLKVQQRQSFWDKQRTAYEKKVAEDELAQSGVGISLDGHWTDAYTGDSLLEAQGRLCNAKEYKDKHNVHKSDWRKLEDAVTQGWSFDNLRVPWLFDDGRISTNKMVMPSAYAFERRAPTYAGDHRFELDELEHAYVNGEKVGMTI